MKHVKEDLVGWIFIGERIATLACLRAVQRQFPGFSITNSKSVLTHIFFSEHLLVFIRDPCRIILVKEIIRALGAIWYFERNLYLEEVIKDAENRANPVLFSLGFVFRIRSEAAIELLKLFHDWFGFTL